RGALLSAILQACYQYKLVKFAFDPSDGEVVAYIDVFLVDAQLTKAQFERCLNVLRNVVMPACNRFKSIVSTGHDPGDKEASTERLDALMQLLQELAEAGPPDAAPSPKAPVPSKQNNRGSKSATKGFDRLLDDVIGDKE